MATEGGAETTDFSGVIGRLEPGRDADAILIDRAGFAFPHWDRDVPLLDALLHRVKSRDVHTSMVAGRVIMQNRQLLFIDKAALMDEIAERLHAAPDAKEIAGRQLAHDLAPYIEAFYESWHDAARAGCDSQVHPNR